MPSMPRPIGKARDIAFDIIGVPENLKVLHGESRKSNKPYVSDAGYYTEAVSYANPNNGLNNKMNLR